MSNGGGGECRGEMHLEIDCERVPVGATVRGLSHGHGLCFSIMSLNMLCNAIYLSTFVASCFWRFTPRGKKRIAKSHKGPPDES